LTVGKCRAVPRQKENVVVPDRKWLLVPIVKKGTQEKLHYIHGESWSFHDLVHGKVKYISL
jgi:hypothetical protein